MNAGFVLENECALMQLSENQKSNRSWTLVYVKSGRGMYLIENDLRALNEGDLLLFSPKVCFSFASKDLGDEYNANLTATVLRFDANWLSSVLAAFPSCRSLILRIKELAGSYIVSGPKWIRMSSLLDEIRYCRDEEQPIKIFTLLELMSNTNDMKLLANHVYVDVQDAVQRKQRIDRYIDCNYCNKLTLENVAQYVGMSRVYFCNFFRNHYSEGFSDYLNRLRVERASVMLANTDKTMEQVANECGFKTVQYFTRAFGKVKGITPGAFRKTTKR